MEITLTGIALIILALSFAVLVIFLVKLLLTLNKNLISLNDHVDELANESKEIVSNVNYKMETLDPLFRAVSNVGENIEYKTRHLKESNAAKIAENFQEEEHPKHEFWLDVVDLIILGISYWNKYKNRR